jgi:hypothetical protein
MKKIQSLGLLSAKIDPDDPLVPYREGVINYIMEESGKTSLPDLVLYMYVMYHPNWIPTKRRGAKTKWSEFLNCAVAAEVNALKDRKKNRKTVIDEMTVDPRWKKLIKESSKHPSENISCAEKDGKKLALYPLMVNARKFAVENDDLVRYYKHIDLEIRKAIKKD